MTPRAAVFVFHDVMPAAELGGVPPTHRPYVLSPEEFRTLLLAAKESPRRSIPVGKVPGELAVGFYALTFDDGSASDYTEAFPALVELGMRATFFIVPTRVGQMGFVTWPQLREMVAAGMEIGSHSLTHPFLHELDRAGLVREFGESKSVLEDRLGTPVHTASLPRGWEPPDLEPVLRDLGYRAFCTSRVAWWQPGGSPFAIPRVGVRHGLPPEDFLAIVDAERRALWRLQATDAAKSAVKSWLGAAGWQRMRTPLLALRYRAGGKA
jgi:peptidoglycan/xylan/chitin deacetylase (PgdA/CDA1 family)